MKLSLKALLAITPLTLIACGSYMYPSYSSESVKHSPDAGCGEDADSCPLPRAIDNDFPSCYGPNCSVATATKPISTEVCPPEMVHVKGSYCTEVKQECDVWLDPVGSSCARCQKYKPSVCVGKRVDKDFCIDRDEYTHPDQTLPEVNITWYKAQMVCQDQGKTLCKDDDWTFACEGEDMNPYTTGLERNCDVCNCDIKNIGRVGHLIDHREPSASLDKCVSPFGVRAMNGNVDEWTTRSIYPAPYKSVLHSGWWSSVRNRCRGRTIAHSELYSDAQVGFRCCSKPLQ